jgi:hypothetical protein
VAADEPGAMPAWIMQHVTIFDHLSILIEKQISILITLQNLTEHHLQILKPVLWLAVQTN